MAKNNDNNKNSVLLMFIVLGGFMFMLGMIIGLTFFK